MDNKEQKEETLSDKIEFFEEACVDGEEVSADVITLDNVKEKIQNAQRRLKNSTILEVIKKDSLNWYDILIRTIDKVFLEEFGEKLI